MTDKEIMQELLVSLQGFRRVMGQSFFVREVEQLENAIARPDPVLAEREACAEICDYEIAGNCAEKIRARGDR